MSKTVVSKDIENKELAEQFQAREAGVMDLFELYARVESVYIAASKASEEGQPITTSNATNAR